MCHPNSGPNRGHRQSARNLSARSRTFNFPWSTKASLLLSAAHQAPLMPSVPASCRGMSESIGRTKSATFASPDISTEANPFPIGREQGRACEVWEGHFKPHESADTGGFAEIKRAEDAAITIARRAPRQEFLRMPFPAVAYLPFDAGTRDPSRNSRMSPICWRRCEAFLFSVAESSSVSMRVCLSAGCPDPADW